MTTENPQKSRQIFYCNNCNYNTSKINDYKKHLLTRKHKINTLSTFSNQNSTENLKKSLQIFNCDICNYNTYNLKDYNKHLYTKKHILSSECTEKYYKCDFCNKEYKERTGLWRHKQKCENKLDNTDKYITDLVAPNSQMMTLVLELVKQNSEFKELLVEQNKQNMNLQNHLLEIAKEKTMNNCLNNTTNNNTTNNNNNNNHFNLQFFLNETCKDAMNISEFIEQINVSLSDLENTGRLGYVEGITRIFVKGLKELDVNQRPIHCSDGKRETLYIKDGNIWEKDDTNKTRLTNAIKKVAHKNIRKITDWVNIHPNCKDSESNKNDLYLKIVSNSMSGCTDKEAEDNYNKIKRNIIKEVIIDK
jgi:hypothetical protein